MDLVIDGFNLLYQIPRLRFLVNDEGLASGLDALMAQVSIWAEAKEHRVTLVFDGENPGCTIPKGRGSELKVHWAGRDADAVVIEYGECSLEPTQVITDDREIVEAVKEAGCQVQSSRVFWRRVLDESEDARVDEVKQRDLPDDEVDGWVNLFREES